MGVLGVHGMELTAAVSIGPGNVTDSPVSWTGGADFERLVGQRVVLEIELSSATAFQIGWRK